MARSTYVVAAGSNRCGRHGRPEAEVAAALGAIRGRVTPSPILASAPLGPSTRRFANAVALIETSAHPETLLRRLKKIERRFGRRAGRRWGARVIDLALGNRAGAYTLSGTLAPASLTRGRVQRLTTPRILVNGAAW